MANIKHKQAVNEQIPAFLIMGNNAEGTQPIIESLGREKVLSKYMLRLRMRLKRIVLSLLGLFMQKPGPIFMFSILVEFLQ